MDLHPYRLRPALRRTASTLRRLFWKALQVVFWGTFFGAAWHLGNTVVGPAIGPSWSAWWNSDAPEVKIDRRLNPSKTNEFFVFMKGCQEKVLSSSVTCKQLAMDVFGIGVLQVELSGGIFVDCASDLPPVQVEACKRSGWKP